MIGENPVAPTTQQLVELSGIEITGRIVVRTTNLAVVERVELAGTEPSTAILKTTRPEMQHEGAVYELASSLDMCGAPLLAAGINSGFPWILVKDLGPQLDDRQPGIADIGNALESLARFHAEFSGSPVNIPNLIDRSPAALLAPDTGLVDLVKEVHGRTGRTLAPTRINALIETLQIAAAAMKTHPFTIVHGDFDPGNLAYGSHRWHVLDWGLSHQNTPLVDVAHMVMRFPGHERSQLTNRYLQAAHDAGLLFEGIGDTASAVQLADIAHRAFFIWWHSYCIVHLGSPVDSLASAVFARLASLTE
jgi:hypothetical protein